MLYPIHPIVFKTVLITILIMFSCAVAFIGLTVVSWGDTILSYGITVCFIIFTIFAIQTAVSYLRDWCNKESFGVLVYDNGNIWVNTPFVALQTLHLSEVDIKSSRVALFGISKIRIHILEENKKFNIYMKVRVKKELFQHISQFNIMLSNTKQTVSTDRQTRRRIV